MCLRGVAFVQLLTVHDLTLRRCDKLGYMEKHYVVISAMFQEADDALFHTILSNKSHVLYTYLSEWPEIAKIYITPVYNSFGHSVPALPSAYDPLPWILQSRQLTSDDLSATLTFAYIVVAVLIASPPLRRGRIVIFRRRSSL